MQNFPAISGRNASSRRREDASTSRQISSQAQTVQLRASIVPVVAVAYHCPPDGRLSGCVLPAGRRGIVSRVRASSWRRKKSVRVLDVSFLVTSWVGGEKRSVFLLSVGVGGRPFLDMQRNMTVKAIAWDAATRYWVLHFTGHLRARAVRCWKWHCPIRPFNEGLQTRRGGTNKDSAVFVSV